MKLAIIPIASRYCIRAGVLGAFGIFCATISSHAAVTTYTNQAAFFNALQDPAYFESFNEFSGQTITGPQAFTFGPVGFTMSGTASNKIDYSTGTAAEGSVYPAGFSNFDSVLLTFSGNVTAIGGTFFLTNAQFGELAGGNVTATLATGESIVLASTSTFGTEPFGGFTSTTPITSLRLSGPFYVNGTSAYVTLDNLYISGTAAVPEPGTWALLAGGGAVLLFAAARRRQTA